MTQIPYPGDTTLEESFLCRLCPFKNEPLYCHRSQEHRASCLIMRKRLEKSVASNVRRIATKKRWCK